jgi:hypothetical protein
MAELGRSDEASSCVPLHVSRLHTSDDVHGFIQFDPEERVWHVKTRRKLDRGHITRGTASSKSIARVQKDPYLPLRQRAEDNGRNLFQPIGRVLLFRDQIVLLVLAQYFNLHRGREGRLLAVLRLPKIRSCTASALCLPPIQVAQAVVLLTLIKMDANRRHPQEPCVCEGRNPHPTPLPKGRGDKSATRTLQSGTNFVLNMSTSDASSKVATCPIFPSLMRQAENRL